jgi:hypothetical protein
LKYLSHGKDSVAIELNKKKAQKNRNAYISIVPSGYRISQDVEDYVMEENKEALRAIDTPKERLELPIIYKEMLADFKEDYYKYCGWDKFKEDTNFKKKDYILQREDDQEYREAIKNYLNKDEQENYEKLNQIQIEQDQKRYQEEKIRKFIELSWKSWMETQTEENPSQKIGGRGDGLPNPVYGIASV